MHDNVKYRNDGNDGQVHDDVQGLRRHVQNGIHDDVQGKRVRKTDVQHVRRHVRGVRNGVRKDGRQDGRVQAVRRGVQKVRAGMQKHDEVNGVSISAKHQRFFLDKYYEYKYLRTTTLMK